jgi:hypothetical protein
MMLKQILPVLVAYSLCAGVNASELVTRGFRIVVTENCPEGETNCQDVTYVGTSKATGKFIRLKGAAVVRLCADRVTPCQHIGYRFPNGRYVYFVGDDGGLIVTHMGKQILSRIGNWQN